MEQPLLDIRGLRTQFFTDDGLARAVDGVSYSLAQRGNRRCCWGIGLWQECHSPVYFAPYPRPSRENR